jgi:hypothetical protein
MVSVWCIHNAAVFSKRSIFWYLTPSIDFPTFGLAHCLPYKPLLSLYLLYLINSVLCMLLFVTCRHIHLCNTVSYNVCYDVSSFVWKNTAKPFIAIFAQLRACLLGACRSIVVKALCYKPQGHGFETQWGEWFLSIYLILPVTLGPGVYSASNRNE